VPPEEQPRKGPKQSVLTELRALSDQAKRGNALALARLRALLDEHPEVWQHAGDLEKIVARAWLELLGDDPLTTAAVRRRAEKLRSELEGESPTALESLLVGQVVSCWLEMAHAQLKAAADGVPVAQASYNLKRAESAQRRYLAAMRTLATLRALLPEGLVPLNQVQLHEPDRKLA
jgi:hypothetical protein